MEKKTNFKCGDKVCGALRRTILDEIGEGKASKFTCGKLGKDLRSRKYYVQPAHDCPNGGLSRGEAVALDRANGAHALHDSREEWGML